jgi:hypothetical protein
MAETLLRRLGGALATRAWPAGTRPKNCLKSGPVGADAWVRYQGAPRRAAAGQEFEGKKGAAGRCPPTGRHQRSSPVRYAAGWEECVSAVSSARMVIVSRSSAAHRARSRVNAAAKASARCKEAHANATEAASRARLRRLYHVLRETPSASHGRCAGRLGPMPCALRHLSERRRAFSRRSASILQFSRVGLACARITTCARKRVRLLLRWGGPVKT